VGEAPYVSHCKQFPSGADEDAPIAVYPRLPDAYIG
jgi:hypothetical protein